MQSHLQQRRRLLLAGEQVGVQALHEGTDQLPFLTCHQRRHPARDRRRREPLEPQARPVDEHMVGDAFDEIAIRHQVGSGDIQPPAAYLIGGGGDFQLGQLQFQLLAQRQESLRIAVLQQQVLILPAQTPIVEKVQPDTPAAAAGLRSSDVITGYNGIHIYHPIALADFIESHANQPIMLQVDRGGKSFDARVTPKVLPGEKTPRIGIQWDTAGKISIGHPNPIEQIYDSVTSTLKTIGAVASPKSDVKLQHLSGPVGIGRIYYLLFQSERGWQLALGAGAEQAGAGVERAGRVALDGTRRQGLIAGWSTHVHRAGPRHSGRGFWRVR